MKKIKYLILILFTIQLFACATVATFPVSTVVPAAEIKVKKKTDSHKNTVLEITALNLASPERLTPASNNYCVWVVTKENIIRNVGGLTIKNAKKI